MRAACATALLVLTGCTVATTTQRAVTRRVAFATLPAAPLALADGAGVELAARIPTAAPEAMPVGGAVSLPTWQPELGAVLGVGERTRASARFALAPAGLGVHEANGARPTPDGAVAWDLGVGLGHDAKLSGSVGVTFAAELSLSGVSLTVSSPLGATSGAVLLPAGRAAVALYLETGPLRALLAGAASAGTWNDFTGERTDTCSLTCRSTETGTVTQTIVPQVGAAVRWQPMAALSLGAEAWLSFSQVATRLPLIVGFSLRAGDLRARRPARPAALPAPPLSPPPLPPPEPEAQPGL